MNIQKIRELVKLKEVFRERLNSKKRTYQKNTDLFGIHITKLSPNNAQAETLIPKNNLSPKIQNTSCSISPSKIPKCLHRKQIGGYKKYKAQNHSHAILNKTNEYTDISVIEKHHQKYQFAYLGISQIAKPISDRQNDASFSSNKESIKNLYNKSLKYEKSVGSVKKLTNLRYGTSQGIYSKNADLSSLLTNLDSIRRGLHLKWNTPKTAFQEHGKRKNNIHIRKFPIENINISIKPISGNKTNEINNNSSRKSSLDLPKISTKYNSNTTKDYKSIPQFHYDSHTGRASPTNIARKTRIILGEKAKEYLKQAKNSAYEEYDDNENNYNFEIEQENNLKPVLTQNEEESKDNFELENALLTKMPVKNQLINSESSMPITIKIPTVQKLIIENNNIHMNFRNAENFKGKLKESADEGKINIIVNTHTASI